MKVSGGHVATCPYNISPAGRGGKGQALALHSKNTHQKTNSQPSSHGGKGRALALRKSNLRKPFLTLRPALGGHVATCPYNISPAGHGGKGQALALHSKNTHQETNSQPSGRGGKGQALALRKAIPGEDTSYLAEPVRPNLDRRLSRRPFRFVLSSLFSPFPFLPYPYL